MPNSHELRAASARLVDASRAESNTDVKKRLAQDALDLAQLAEQLDRADSFSRRS